MKSLLPNKQLLPSLFTSCLLTGIVYAPILYRMNNSAYDFVTHQEVAAGMLQAGSVTIPHFLLHLAVITFSFFSPGAIPLASFIVTLLAMLATAAIITATLAKENVSPTVSVLITLALMIAAPAAILAPLDKHFYRGYVNLTSYHNPTMLLLKPFSLLSFGLILKAFANSNNKSVIIWSGCIITTIACALTKPSFTICILPAAALLLAVHILQKYPADWKLLLCSLFIPALLTLAYQYSLTYGGEQLPGIYTGKSGIIFKPLAVMKHYSSWLFPKFLLSLLFPLTVLLSDFRRAMQDTSLRLAWLTFLAGSIYTYLLAESGPRIYHGNFFWSADITSFVLFVYSAKFMLRKHAADGHGISDGLLKNSGCAKTIGSSHPHKAAFEDGGEMAVFQQPANTGIYLSYAALLLHAVFGALFYSINFLMLDYL